MYASSTRGIARCQTKHQLPIKNLDEVYTMEEGNCLGDNDARLEFTITGLMNINVIYDLFPLLFHPAPY